MSSKEVRLEMMTLLDKARIIDMHLRGMKNTEIAEDLGIHRNTVGKYVREYESHAEALRRCDADDRDAVRKATEAITAAPAYDTSKRGPRKWNEDMDAMLDSILADEECKRKELGSNKQMLTKTQIHGLMVDAGFDIGITTVQKRVDAKRSRPKEAFIAQSYEYGDRFEYDFREVKLRIGGVSRKLYLAVMVAPASDYRFVLLYDNQRKQIFADSQVRFFEHTGGCFKEGVYDNMRNVVKKFIGRNEAKSMIITTNLTFDRWEEVFGDPILTGCIVERLNYRFHVIDMTGDSYRVLETNRWRREEISQKEEVNKKG